PNPYRRAQAQKIGALAMPPGDEVVERCRELAGPRGGFDVAFECSGAPAALPSLFEALHRESTLVTVGHPSRPTEIDIAAHINKKGITLRGIFGRRLWGTWEQTMLLLDSGRLDLEWLITHRLPVGQIDAAGDLLHGGRRQGPACAQPALTRNGGEARHRAELWYGTARHRAVPQNHLQQLVV